jgi:hypothetical protein
MKIKIERKKVREEESKKLESLKRRKNKKD